MTKIEEAKKQALQAFRRRQRGRGPMTTIEECALEASLACFAAGFDAAVAALKR
jgi:hypothetical protein